MTRTLYVLACGAAPAADLDQLVRLAQSRDWDVCAGTTPAGWRFIDPAKLADLTGHEVRRDYSGRTSGWPAADAVVVAPATINTINKFAAGIADCWALSVMTECYGHSLPIVLAANINPALARHPRFRSNVDELRGWGISVLWEPEPAPPVWMHPWSAIFDELQRSTGRG